MFGDSAGRTVWADVPYPADDETSKFCAGDLVCIGKEPALGIVVRPTHQAASRLPDDASALDSCAVPAALVRSGTRRIG